MTNVTASLYKRKAGYIPRVAAVHDMCGYGKCSLTVAIPVLSAAGIDVCPVPTALLSAHTRYPNFTFFDTTEMLDEYLDAWITEDVDLDAVYSGFLGNADQVAVIQRLYATYDVLRVVDPVMGDAGQMYPTYTDELCDAMRNLVQDADILTPNLTEASILTGDDYPGVDITPEHAEAIIDKLLAMGAKNVVLKGIDHDDGKIRNFVKGISLPFTEDVHEKLPYMLHGTGDVFTSALLGAIMAERTLPQAAAFAGEFVRAAMETTRAQPEYDMRGVSFELVLSKMAELLD